MLYAEVSTDVYLKQSKKSTISLHSERAHVFSDFTVLRLLSFSKTELLPLTIAGTALGAGG